MSNCRCKYCKYLNEQVRTGQIPRVGLEERKLKAHKYEARMQKRFLEFSKKFKADQKKMFDIMSNNPRGDFEAQEYLEIQIQRPL